MNKRFLIFALIMTLLVLPIAYAGFSYKGESVSARYTSGETIKGTINISFSNEPTSSIMRTNYGGNITLLELLQKNGFEEGVEFSCNFRNCSADYAKSTKTGTIVMTDGEQRTIGFEIVGDYITQIDSIKFSIESNAVASCSRQLLIDLLDKGEYLIQNDKKTVFECGLKNWGCFDSSASSEMANLVDSFSYCEKVYLPVAPAYKIGATVKNGTGAATLTMKLADLDGNEIDSCELPAQSSETETLSCNTEYGSNVEGDFYVCISSSNPDANYKIRIERSGNKCGARYDGSSIASPGAVDYEIFAQSLMFNSVGTLDVNESSFAVISDGNSLADYANGYLSEKYDNNCTRGCIIPFGIKGISQTLTIKNSEIRYTEEAAGSLSGLDMYNLVKANPTLTTPSTVLIDVSKAGLVIPISESGTKTLSIYLGNSTLFSKSINITKGFDFTISPESVYFGESTLFRALTDEVIVSSSWDFGDGTKEDATGGTVLHRYTSYKPTYSVEVRLVSRSNIVNTRKFNISVGSLNESATRIINKYSAMLSNLTSEKSKFSSAVASEIDKKINISYLNSELNRSKAQIKNATSSGYASIIAGLIALNIPVSIRASEEGKSLPIEIGFSNIDSNYLAQISNQEVTNVAGLEQNILNWFGRNYEGKVDYQIISAENEAGEEEPLFTYFKYALTQKEGAASGKAYFIIGRPEASIDFLGGESANEAGSGAYIEVEGDKTIEFALSGEVKPASLGAYISASVDELSAGYEGVEIPGFRTLGFTFGLIVLIVIFFVVYILLQEWYKKHYENSLFKNSDDLYNLVSFIFNSRKKEMKDEEIRSKLSGAGWNGERITYAFNKIDGKRTGMWEIPVLKFIENRKVSQEIEKRQYSIPARAPPGLTLQKQ